MPESTPRCSQCLYALWATGTALRAARRAGLRAVSYTHLDVYKRQAYNRDMQEDKEGFLDADRTVESSLRLMAGMLEELTFRTDRMREALSLIHI